MNYQAGREPRGPNVTEKKSASLDIYVWLKTYPELVVGKAAHVQDGDLAIGVQMATSELDMVYRGCSNYQSPADIAGKKKPRSFLAYKLERLYVCTPGGMMHKIHGSHR
jgi:hypothetical protein